MAYTEKGYYYPSEAEFGDSDADVLFHLMKMAESNDDVLEDYISDMIGGEY